MRRILSILCLALSVLSVAAQAADWTEYRTGPFKVYSNAGDRAARERLTQVEQLRFVLGSYIGKESLGRTELTTLWPLHLVLFVNQKEYTPHVLSLPLIDGGGSTLAAWYADSAKDTPLPRDVLRALTQKLTEDNVGRMPAETETALCDLLSTIEVNATRVRVGAPLPAGELTGERLRAWAKLHMLATQPLYSGKLRIYLNNLLNAGEEDQASRNAFDMPAAQLNQLADAYLRAGKFEAVPLTGRAIAPNRDFFEKDIDRPAVDALMAELSAQGKTFTQESPRGLLAKNTRPALELAIAANPKWAEPQFKIAQLETDPAQKIARLKMAATLAPRNPTYWQTLAETQANVNLFADAEKSWLSAERAARNPQERERIHQAKLALQESRAAFDLAEHKRILDEEARELQRIKDESLAEVRNAQQAANVRLGANDGNTKGAVAWFGEPEGTKIAGTLSRVDCLSGPLRLTIQTSTGIAVRLLIRDPKKLAVADASVGVEFQCGVQKTAKKIEAIHNAKADAKTDTVGDVLMVKFP